MDSRWNGRHHESERNGVTTDSLVRYLQQSYGPHVRNVQRQLGVDAQFQIFSLTLRELMIYASRVGFGVKLTLLLLLRCVFFPYLFLVFPDNKPSVIISVSFSLTPIFYYQRATTNYRTAAPGVDALPNTVTFAFDVSTTGGKAVCHHSRRGWMPAILGR